MTFRAAARRIAPFVYHSPCPYSMSLSRLCGCEIYCKLDHLQITGSFKERGARNKLMQLPASARSAGVVAAWAGNHALGLAYHAREMEIPVTVVMPARLARHGNARRGPRARDSSSPRKRGLLLHIVIALFWLNVAAQPTTPSR